MKIIVDDLSGETIAAFLQEHIHDMRAVSPPESKHALDLDGLRKPGITFWSVWDAQRLMGCGALKRLDRLHGEIKSMRTDRHYHQRGVASAMLQHILDAGRQQGLKRISLETGSMPFFEPARRLYTKFGFMHCEPFADYKADPNSVFMSRAL